MEKTFCSFYYQVCPSDNTELKLEKANTALLVIDLQRVYTKLADKDPRWNAFSKRLNETVLPNVKKIEALFRKNKQDVIFARIACHLKDGRDRSLSQKMSGWNNILITLDDDDCQIIDDIAPVNDEIVVTKTTDSALTGTNLRLILNNLGIKTV
ncbi:MAG: cysteine hydrolase family protein, partial [Succinivibrio sp.]|nr:cysteine hydrolase family protein [Succinivibrio sp.]